MSNAAAKDAFIKNKAKIDTMLSRLQGLSEDHFGADPDNITWGDAAEIAHYAYLLMEITDKAFQEGEYS